MARLAGYGLGVLLLVLIAVTGALNGSARGDQNVNATRGAKALKANGGEVALNCRSPRMVGRLHPDAYRRAISAGPLMFLGARGNADTTERYLTPVDAERGLFRAPRIMLGIRPGRSALVTIAPTRQQSAAFLRSKFVGRTNPSDGYRLDQGHPSLRVKGCPRAHAIYGGALILTGPQCVRVTVRTLDTGRVYRRRLSFGGGACGTAKHAATTPIMRAKLCSPAEITELTHRFVNVFNRGAFRTLDRRVFAAEPRFRWYSAGPPGRRLGPAAQNRATLVSYLRRRHDAGERLRLVSLKVHGNSRPRGHDPWGNFEYRLTRVPSEQPRTGKGAAYCFSARPDLIFVWSVGDPVP